MVAALRRRAAPYFLLGPGTIWLVLFFVVPLFYLGKLSLESGFVGAFEFNWNWSNYQRSALVLRHPVRPFLHLRRDGDPALADHRLPTRLRDRLQGGAVEERLLFAVVAPFFTTYLIRTIAWETILSDDSPVTKFLHTIGLAPSGHILATSWRRDRRPHLQLPTRS